MDELRESGPDYGSSLDPDSGLRRRRNHTWEVERGRKINASEIIEKWLKNDMEKNQREFNHDINDESIKWSVRIIFVGSKLEFDGHETGALY